MWNDIDTGKYEGMIAETITLKGYNDDKINVYYSKPLNTTNYPSIVLIPHMPGWDEFCRETARRFTQHGYAVMCPDIYARFGTGNPSDISKLMREKGGVPDVSVIKDCESSAQYLKAQQNSNGKVGVIGMCSGGRHAFLAACMSDEYDACVDLWGGGVSMNTEDLTPQKPVAPIDYTKNLSCPLLGIFGNDDKRPSPEEVNTLEKELQKYNKTYDFYRYDNAGHAFWSYNSANYRFEQAMDSWEKVFEFFEKHLK